MLTKSSTYTPCMPRQRRGRARERLGKSCAAAFFFRFLHLPDVSGVADVTLFFERAGGGRGPGADAASCPTPIPSPSASAGIDAIG